MRNRSRAAIGCVSLLALSLASACEGPGGDPARTDVVGPPVPSGDHGSFDTSDGIYRIPYADGDLVRVTRDHHDHTPPDRIDIAGDQAGFEIVAAASGWIRAVVDRHGNSPGAGDGLSADGSQPHDDALEHSCTDPDTVEGSCGDYNNYVWIEHPNGEWTKYTHFGTGTVTDNGWQVDDWIEAGEVLGVEGDVGAASGRHLHNEVGLPHDPEDLTPFTELGGFMLGASVDFGVNLVPRVCDIPDLLYVTGEEYTANPCDHEPPVADADGPYEVDEGSTVVLDGTESSDPEGLPLTYLWEPGDDLDDASLAQPTFLGVDDGIVDLTLTVYDRVEALADADQTSVTVHNVGPTVTIDPQQTTVIAEGETLEVSAFFTDPGVLDAPFDAGVRCYDVPDFSLSVDATVEVTSTDGPLEGAVSASCPFGDTSQSGEPLTGTFLVIVSVTDKDGATGEASFEVTVENVSPDAGIDDSQATDVDGSPTFIATAGAIIDFSGRVTDPGSDDLFLTWDWDDGSTDQATYLLDPPDPDPFPSPNVSPRDETDPQSHAWMDACLYVVSLTAVDDDGGEGSDEATVVITDTSGRARSAGYWMSQYRSNRPTGLGTETLTCYLAIAEHMSAVFDEVRNATGSLEEAADVLHTGGSRGDMTELFERQLLAAWLNFASGAFGWTELVDTTGDGMPDTPFSTAITVAEDVRLDPNASQSDLEAQKDVLEAINLMDGD